MDDRYLRAETLFNNGDTEESLVIINELLFDDCKNVDLLFLKAKIFYRMQRWGEALNNLNLILEIQPDHLKAKNYISMVMNIISFWNKENFNP